MDLKDPEDLKPSHSVRLSRIAEPSLKSIGHTSSNTRTLEHSQPTLFAETELPLMSSAAGSRARTFRTQVNAPAFPESVQDSTGNWCEPFAWYDRSTQLWRTWQRCLETEWEPFLGTWPRAGLILNGIAYLRRPSAPLTNGTVFGSLPTPIANDAEKRGDFDIDRSKCLPGELRRRNLPTPRASDADKGGRGDLLTVLRGYETRHAGTLPTPQARDWKDGSNPKPHGKHSPSLPVAIAIRGGPGRMNPKFREWMMGFPIGWTQLVQQATPLSRKSPNSSAKRSCKRRV